MDSSAELPIPHVSREELQLVDGFMPGGWFLNEEIAVLFAYGRTLPKVNPVIVEIGSWLGRSSVVLARSIKDRVDPKVYCVDPWKGGEGFQYDKALKDFNIARSDVFSTFWSNMVRAEVDAIIQPCPGTSEHWANLLRHLPIDLLFIDGDHSDKAVAQDLRMWTPMLKSGGVLAMHDFYLPDANNQTGYETGPYNAVKEVLIGEKWSQAALVGSLLTMRKL